MTRLDVIDDKCDDARCDERARTRHKALFLEQWDVHPPDDFRKWWARNPEAQYCKPITAWNTDRTRQEFYRARAGT